MEGKDFNWYEDVGDIDVEEFQPVEKDRYQVSKLFNTTCKIFKYASISCAIIYAFRYIFHKGPNYIHGIKINTILISAVIFCGSLNMFATLFNAVITTLNMLGADLLVKRIKSMYRWTTLAAWFMLNYYLLKYVEADFIYISRYVKSFLISGILTSIVYSIVTLLMQFFYESFVAKSLYAKMKEVDIKERIIAVMKSYRYEISDSSSSNEQEFTCVEMCCGTGEDANGSENASHINLRKDEQANVGGLYFKPPEIHSIYDAKTLARDVFNKITDGNEELDFTHFAQMFPSAQIAVQAFSYFDVNDDRSISKKEFRDTIIQFYLDRINLEKGFDIAKGFVDIVNDIFSIVVLGFLLLAYLVIFGIPLKDLMALALSSALVLNFAVSGMAVDLYFNFMVLLSHPFDIGDEVIIDGEDFTVHRIGLNSTSFLGKNGGKVKYLNSVLWKKSLINMTRSPEKVIILTFELNPDISIMKFRDFKAKIHTYLKKRSFDFFETFSLEGTSESDTDINKLNCTLIIKCKGYKNKTRKFQLRFELNTMARNLIQEMEMN